MDLLASPNRLLVLIDSISNGSAFLRPCGLSQRFTAATFPKPEDELNWEQPTWVALRASLPTHDKCCSPPVRQLSLYIAGLFERLLWLGYAISLAAIDRLQPACLREIDAAIATWSALNPRQRTDLLAKFQEKGHETARERQTVCEIKRRAEGSEKVFVTYLLTRSLADSDARRTCRLMMEFIAPSGTAALTVAKRVQVEEPVRTQENPTRAGEDCSDRQRLARKEAKKGLSKEKPGLETSGTSTMSGACMKMKQGLETTGCEDEIMNTSISTQMSAKSKCGSRRVSVDESSLLNATLGFLPSGSGKGAAHAVCELDVVFVHYSEEDVELFALKTTKRFVSNAIERLADEVPPTEIELEFRPDLEREEIEKSRPNPEFALSDISDFSILKMYWGQSASHDVSQMFPKDEPKACKDPDPKPLALPPCPAPTPLTGLGLGLEIRAGTGSGADTGIGSGAPTTSAPAPIFAGTGLAGPGPGPGPDTNRADIGAGNICCTGIGIGIGMGMGEEDKKQKEKQEQQQQQQQQRADFAASIAELKAETQDDVRSVWKPRETTAKSKYDYLELPTKTWPSRPTQSSPPICEPAKVAPLQSQEHSFRQGGQASVSGDCSIGKLSAHEAMTASMGQVGRANFSFGSSFFAEDSHDFSLTQSLADNQNFMFLTQEDFSSGAFESTSFYHQLTKEIEMIVAKIHEYHQRLESYRAKLLGLLEQSIIKHFAPKKVTVEMYGSMKTNLAVERSDIDLRVGGLPASGPEDIKQAAKLLERKLRTVKSVKSTAFILTARVPVIKLVCGVERGSRRRITRRWWMSFRTRARSSTRSWT